MTFELYVTLGILFGIIAGSFVGFLAKDLPSVEVFGGVVLSLATVLFWPVTAVLASGHGIRLLVDKLRN